MGRGEGWLEGCQGRRERGGVEVVGEGGTTSTLRPGVTHKRHFFGLCPSCLSIGEHSACSGRYCYSHQPTLYPFHPMACALTHLLPRLPLGLLLLPAMPEV